MTRYDHARPGWAHRRREQRRAAVKALGEFAVVLFAFAVAALYLIVLAPLPGGK